MVRLTQAAAVLLGQIRIVSIDVMRLDRARRPRRPFIEAILAERVQRKNSGPPPLMRAPVSAPGWREPSALGLMSSRRMFRAMRAVRQFLASGCTAGLLRLPRHFP